MIPAFSSRLRPQPLQAQPCEPPFTSADRKQRSIQTGMHRINRQHESTTREPTAARSHVNRGTASRERRSTLRRTVRVRPLAWQNAQRCRAFSHSRDVRVSRARPIRWASLRASLTARSAQGLLSPRSEGSGALRYVAFAAAPRGARRQCFHTSSPKRVCACMKGCRHGRFHRFQACLRSCCARVR